RSFRTHDAIRRSLAGFKLEGPMRAGAGRDLTALVENAKRAGPEPVDQESAAVSRERIVASAECPSRHVPSTSNPPRARKPDTLPSFQSLGSAGSSVSTPPRS